MVAHGNRYEWGPDHIDGKGSGAESYPAETDQGRTTKTGSELTLRIDPKNLGVMLHRSKIRVRVRFTPVTVPLSPGYPVPELAWSEIRYVAYRYRMPKF